MREKKWIIKRFYYDFNLTRINRKRINNHEEREEHREKRRKGEDREREKKYFIDIVFSPPILGEVFFDYLFFPPNEFIKVRNEYKAGFEPDTKDKTVKGVNLYFGDKDNSAVYDFYKMTQCDVLISSPSTFAIFGGCLGKRKKIIHSRKWLDYSIERNDTFWVKLSKSDSPYYSLWRAF